MERRRAEIMLTLRALLLLGFTTCIVGRAIEPDIAKSANNEVEFDNTIYDSVSDEVSENEHQLPIDAQIWLNNETARLNSLVEELQAESIEQSLRVQDIVNKVKWLRWYDETRKELQSEFALTPRDDAYFDPTIAPKPAEVELCKKNEDDKSVIDPTPDSKLPRESRQNPNMGHTRALHAGDLDKLKIGLSNKEYRIPVSLVPSNLNWLKIYRPIEVNQSANEDLTANSYHLENGFPAGSNTFYAVVLIATITTAVVVALLGFLFACFTFSKRAKAAAEVDYPAYGVTGPTVDLTADKLARAAHIYNYQHQKQLITGMERNGLERCASYGTDPESDDENEEGQYTVYECPGFATTADIEIKNPLFYQESAPSTPGKRDVLKPQPKK